MINLVKLISLKYVQKVLALRHKYTVLIQETVNTPHYLSQGCHMRKNICHGNNLGASILFDHFFCKGLRKKILNCFYFIFFPGKFSHICRLYSNSSHVVALKSA